MANARYTISFPPSDHELLHFVENKKKSQNFSAYVRELIRDDMDAQDKLDLEKVYEYVLKRIKEDGFIADRTSSKKVTNFINEADKEIIMDLF